MMTKKQLKILIVLAISFFLISPVHAANDWQTIFENLSEADTISGTPQQAELYEADINFIITNQNGIETDFDDNDTIKLRLSGNGINLKFNGDKTGLIAWAEENSDALFEAIFGSSPDIAMSGMTSTMSNTQQLFFTVFSSPEPNYLDAVTLKEDTNAMFVPVSNNDIVIKAQYDFMEILGDDADGSSGMVSYESKFGEDNFFSLGLVVPYRQLSIDDDLDTEYHYISFLPFAKYRWYMNRSLLEWVFNLTAGLSYQESDLFPDGSGYWEYGFGTGLKYAYAVSSKLSLNASLLYQGLEKEIPSDLVDEELQWVSDAFDNLPFQQTLTPGIGAFYNMLPGKLSFRGEIFRVHQLNDTSSDYENQTVVFGGANYYFTKSSRISLGYKESFEMNDITDRSLLVDYKFSW
ncbi:MAG: hypothetical protein K9L30_05680 [Desulfobacterales bacterium]|nr:hypothetical protein [Desulfobacterales bacterium]